MVAVAGAGWPVVAEKVAPAAAEPEAFLVGFFFFFLSAAGWTALATGTHNDASRPGLPRATPRQA